MQYSWEETLRIEIAHTSLQKLNKHKKECPKEMRDNFLWTNLLLKGELESNKGFFDGNYKRIIDVERTNLISRSAFLKKITYTRKLSRNIFFQEIVTPLKLHLLRNQLGGIILVHCPTNDQGVSFLNKVYFWDISQMLIRYKL